MKFISTFFFYIVFCSGSAFAEETCNEWLVAPIVPSNSGGKLIYVCYGNGNVRVDHLPLANISESEVSDNNTKTVKLDSKNLLKGEFSLSALAIEQIEAVISASRDANEEYSPTKYELSKSDVNNGFWSMVAAIFSALCMLATVILLWWNAKQFQTANRLSQKMANVAQKTMTSQLRPVLSMTSAEISDIVKMENGTVSAMILMTIENTGHSEAELIGGWVSVEKSKLQAWGNGQFFEPEVVSVDRQGPRHIFLNRGNTAKMLCYITVKEIPDFIPEEKVGFNIMASVTSKDIGTLEKEGCIRITHFNPVRTIANFSESKKEWGAVKLLTEIGNSGDRVITEEDLKEKIDLAIK